MHVAGSLPTTTEADGPPAGSHRGRFLAAGVALTTAAAVAVTPALVTPSLPEVTVAAPTSVETVHLSAFENPLEVWQEVLSGPRGLVFQLSGLGERTFTSWAKLSAALGDESVLGRLGNDFTGVFDDPLRIARGIAAAPAKYGPTVQAALQGSSEASWDALRGLFSERHARNNRGALLYVQPDGSIGTAVTDTPALAPPLVQEFTRLLFSGQFVDAFSEVNLWLLMDVLSDQRAGILDAIRVPGDLLEDLGFETLARILGTSWMGPNDGLLTRGRLGNLARALLAPAVTAAYQTTEILDAVRVAVQDREFDTAVSLLINAPAKIVNAFLNGYESSMPDADDYFPGVFSDRGTFNFFFNEIPDAIATALKLEKPAPPESTALTVESPEVSVTGVPGDGALVPLSLDVDATSDIQADSGLRPKKQTDSEDALAPETSAPATKLTLRQRVAEVRAEAAEKRKERKATVERVRSDIRRSLGVDRDKDTRSATTADNDTNSGGGAPSASGGTEG